MSGARASWAAAGVLSLVSFLICLGTNARTSATWDEPFYMAEGLGWWLPHDYRMVREAPPLPAVLGTAAVLSLRPDFPLQDPSWAEGNTWTFPDVLVNRRNREIAPELFFRARIPISLVGALGVLVVFAWARRLSSDLGGVVAAALMAFSPSWLAHSSLFTTDVVASVTLAATIAYATTLPARSELGWKPATALGVLVFLALAAKFTGLLLALLLPILAVAIALRRTRAGLPSASVTALARLHVRAAVVSLTLLALVVYPGEFGLAGYVKGLTLLYKGLDPTWRYFYCGSYSRAGWPTYGLASLALKSPPGGLALVLLGTGLAVRRVRARPELLGPLVLAAAILAVSLLDKAAFGVRRVLPALPALFVLGGVAAGELSDLARRSSAGKAGLALALALVLSDALSCARAYPDFIPYVSDLAGGSERAADSFSDSNVDWGQALPDVRRLLETREKRPLRVKILYYGRVDPSLYRVDGKPVTSLEELARPEPDTLYVCSVSRLHQARGAVLAGELPPEADWLTRRVPWARAGDSIFLYITPERP